MSGISRLFKPSNDKSIIRNLISEPQEYDKIKNRTLTVLKKTALVDLKAKIDAFIARWSHKAMPCLWNPIFVAEFLAIKEAEAKQSPGQKIFLAIWIHPLLLSIRCCLFCPAVGYKESDLGIMSKSIDKLNDVVQIIENNGQQGLKTVTERNCVPDSFFPEIKLPEEDMAEAMKTDPDGSFAVQKTETDSTLDNQDIKQEQKPIIFNPPMSAKSLPKPKPSSSPNLAVRNEGKIIFVIALPMSYDLNMGTTNVQTIITNNYSKYRVRPEFDIYLRNLPELSRCLVALIPSNNYFRLTINNCLVPIAEVVEDQKSSDEFSSDLDENYLNHLTTVVQSDSLRTPPSNVSLSSLTLSTDAPKTLNKTLRADLSDMQNLRLDQLFEEDDDKDDTPPFHVLNVSTDSGVVVRQYKNTWKASTPDGKLLKGGRGQFSPK